MNMFSRSLFVILMITSAVCVTFAQIGPTSDMPLSILFIGNSYTAGIKSAFNTLASASSRPIHVEFIHPGGKTLLWHAESEQVASKLKERHWDVVVLQDQSQTPAYFPQHSLDAIRKLDAPIKAAGARTVLFQTWGRRDGDTQNSQVAPDYLSMQKLLTSGYAAAGQAVGAQIAAVGETWRKVHEEDESLFLRLYRKDGSHPSAAGGYLAACVLYKTATGNAPPNRVHPPGVTREDAIRLWALASKL